MKPFILPISTGARKHEKLSTFALMIDVYRTVTIKKVLCASV